MKRLTFIAGASVLLLVACSEGPASSQASQTAETAPEPEVAAASADEQELVEFLFVQHADRVTLENGLLTLDGVGDTVLFFSDRPDRIVGRESLAMFLSQWDTGEESFATVPPNAVITVMREGQALDAAVVLSNPVMAGENSMTYTVEILDGPESGIGDDAAIFIDAFGFHGKDVGKPGKPGKPGDPGDPDVLRGAEPGIPGAEVGKPGKPNVEDADVEAQVKKRRGRGGMRKFKDGARKFQDGAAEALDRVF